MKKTFLMTLILFLVMPLCALAADGSDCDVDNDGDVDAADLALLAENFGKLCWYKDADGDKYSDGTKVWAVSRPPGGYYRAEELTSLWGDPDDEDSSIIPVWEGDYVINGPADIDAISGYVEVTGNLIVNSNLISLSGLENLTTVGGVLGIQNNVALTSLSGLENLTTVGGELYIGSNNSLTSLDGLENLTTVGEHIDIEDNAALTSLSGLEKLTTVSDSLYIGYNAALTSLLGLEKLTTVGDSLHIDNNAALTSLSGLENLTTVDNDLEIRSNPALTSLTGLEELTMVGDSLHIDNNDALMNLAGLDNLITITDSLMIYNNTALTNLSGLDHFTTFNQLSIDNNAALTSLSGLENLTTLTDSMIIYNNAALTSLSGLENLTTAESLRISNNSGLANLSGLENLITINWDLEIENNTALPTCEAEWLRDNIGVSNIEGSISIYGNCDACTCMAQVPAGCFDMGDHFAEGRSSELPVHNVCISGFEMDIHEITNAEYAECVADGGCTQPGDTGSFTRATYYGAPMYDDFPVIYVDWYQVSDYCTWAGKRLPTEAEWEYAARGGLAGKRYPWGDTISGTDANYLDSGDTWDNDTSPRGYYPPNGYGLYDMAGNVAEWVEDDHHGSYDCDANPGFNCGSGGLAPIDGSAWVDTPRGQQRVIRSGAYSVDTIYVRVAFRNNHYPDSTNLNIGGRCARD